MEKIVYSVCRNRLNIEDNDAPEDIKAYFKEHPYMWKPLIEKAEEKDDGSCEETIFCSENRAEAEALFEKERPFIQATIDSGHNCHVIKIECLYLCKEVYDGDDFDSGDRIKTAYPDVTDIRE